MKLHTMLLPTGEFILVGSSIARPLPDRTLLDGLKDAIGAAAVLMVEQDVDAEDAVYDENARRTAKHLEHVHQSNWLPKTVLPRATDPSGNEYRLELTTAPGDVNLLAALHGGADFSPAGLVKSVGDRSVQDYADAGHIDLGGAKTEISAEPIGQELVDSVYGEKPHLDSQTVTAADIDRHTFHQIPGEFGRSPHTGPQNHDLDLDSLTVSDDDEPARPFRKGDRVLMKGKSLFGLDFTGITGTVATGNLHGSGRITIKSDQKVDYIRVPLMRLEDLELLDG